MAHLRWLSLSLLLFLPIVLNGQTAADWQEDLRQWVTAEDAEADSWQEMQSDLTELAEHPINLNQTSREELEQLPFLSSQQIEQLLSYVYRYGPMRSLGELQMLTALDARQRRLLSHFVTVEPPAAKSVKLHLDTIRRHGCQEVLATAQVPLYQRAGYRNGYLGYGLRHSLRYQFSYRDQLKFGITGAQDAGEPFFANRNRLGYDHYSYYFQLNRVGRLQTLCLGQYRVQLGMGLVANAGFHLGKLATLQAIARTPTAIRAHTSRSAADYMQGAAATVRLSSRWRATAFVSYRPLDATLNDDGSVRTLITSGYHRTPTEMSKKENTHEWDAGISAGWRKGAAYADLNALYTRLDRPLHPQAVNALYRRYAAEGNDFVNASLSYGYANGQLSFSGETALNRHGALAAIHRLSYRLSTALTAMVLHRYYGRSYTALHARSFGEGSSVQNEHGLYAGLTWQPSQRLSVYGYADYAHFGWPRYGVSMTSDAFDALLHARVLYKRCTLEGRYRFHLRQRDNDDKTMLVNRLEHRAMLRLSYPLARGLSGQTQADAVAVARQHSSRGWMVSQQLACQHRWLQLSANVAYFDTDDYDARLYQYERTVLYAYSFPMYYGQGLRLSVMARADLGRHLMLTAKVGLTDYLDRTTIGSGLQQIAGSSMTDIDLQLRWRF